MPQLGDESAECQCFPGPVNEQFERAIVELEMINDVSDTAFWVASYRATETERPDALFRDPLAGRLAGERGREIARTMPRTRMTGWTVVMRTLIIDEYIRQAVADGVDTILNLGAGLDTRPYRLNVPASLRWIEVDYPHVIEFKERELANETPRCRLERVKIDLADRTLRQEFLKATSDTSPRILVLTEGVVPYLTVEQTGTLADDLNATPHVEKWVVDYFSAEAMKMLSKSAMQERLSNAPFQFFPDDWYAFFKSHGWQPKQMKYLAEEGFKTGRAMPLPFVFRMVMRIFVSGARKQAGARWSGYALMERT